MKLGALMLSTAVFVAIHAWRGEAVDHIEQQADQTVSTNLQTLARAGDVFAINAIAEQIARKDREKALGLLDEAIHQNSERALFIKGKIYFEAIGGPPNWKEGRRLIESAALNGDAEALYYLTQLALRVGDLENAELYMSEAHLFGSNAYERTEGLYAFMLSSLCSDIASDISSLDDMFQFYFSEGLGTYFGAPLCLETDDRKAFKLAKAAANEVSYFAYITLGLMHMWDPDSSAFPFDEKLAEAALSQASSLGGAHADLLIALYLHGKNQTLSKQFLQKSAEGGDAEAALVLGVQLLKESNHFKACLWLAKAVERGVSSSVLPRAKCEVDEAHSKKHALAAASTLNAMIGLADEGSYRLLIQESVRHGDLEKAEAYFQEGHRRGFEMLHWDIADVYLQKGRTNEAFNAFLEAGQEEFDAFRCAPCVENKLGRLPLPLKRMQQDLIARFQAYAAKHSQQSVVYVKQRRIEWPIWTALVGVAVLAGVSLYKKGYLEGVRKAR